MRYQPADRAACSAFRQPATASSQTRIAHGQRLYGHVEEGYTNCSRQASAEHFQQCAEFLLLRDCGLGPSAVAVLRACQRLGRSFVVSRSYNKFYLEHARGFLTLCCLRLPFSFAAACGDGFQYADVTLRRFGIPRRERTMWHVEHSTGEFRLCRNRVARRLAELLNAEEIERGSHDGDQ